MPLRWARQPQIKGLLAQPQPRAPRANEALPPFGLRHGAFGPLQEEPVVHFVEPKLPQLVVGVVGTLAIQIKVASLVQSVLQIRLCLLSAVFGGEAQTGWGRERSILLALLYFEV